MRSLTVLLSLFLVATHVYASPINPRTGSTFRVAGDDAWNTYYGGSFSGTVDFDPGAGVDLRTSVGGNDAFVSCFNADGTYAWTRTFAGNGNETLDGLLTDGVSVYASGLFSSANFGVDGAGAIAAVGSTNAYIVRLEASSGQVVNSFGQGGFQIVRSVLTTAADLKLTSNRLYVAGRVQGAVTLVTGESFTSIGAEDAYVLALDPVSAVPLNAFSGDGFIALGGTGGDFAYRLALTSSNLYVCGSVYSSDFGVGAAGSVASAGDSDAFVAALSLGGTAVTGFSGDGVQTFSGTGSQSCLSLSATDDVVYMAGIFGGNDAGVGATGSIASNGFSDGYLLALDSNGAPNAAFSSDGVKVFGGPQIESGSSVIATEDTVFWGVSGAPGAALDGGAAFSIMNADTFVFALDTSGQPSPNYFARDGVLQLAGSESELLQELAVTAGRLLLAGRVTLGTPFGSTEASVDGITPVTIAAGSSYSLELSALDGSPIWRVANGANTASGPTGAAGATGPTGANGAAGANGANGPAGANGTNGTDGPPGGVGATGGQGGDGRDALLAVDTEPAGAACAAGGLRISAGNDSNGNGALDGDEATTTRFVCNGVSAAPRSGCTQVGTGAWFCVLAVVAALRRRRVTRSHAREDSVP